MKKPFRFLLCLALLFVSGCSGYQKTIRFGAADIGGIYYTFANTFTGLASSEDDTYQFEVKTTAGSAANLRLLSGGYIEPMKAVEFLRESLVRDIPLLPGFIRKPVRLSSVQTPIFRRWMIYRAKPSASVRRIPVLNRTLTRF